MRSDGAPELSGNCWVVSAIGDRGCACATSAMRGIYVLKLRKKPVYVGIARGKAG
jgi:hypothetical protein